VMWMPPVLINWMKKSLRFWKKYLMDNFELISMHCLLVLKKSSNSRVIIISDLSIYYHSIFKTTLESVDSKNFFTTLLIKYLCFLITSNDSNSADPASARIKSSYLEAHSILLTFWNNFKCDSIWFEAFLFNFENYIKKARCGYLNYPRASDLWDSFFFEIFGRWVHMKGIPEKTLNTPTCRSENS
jgi:hypothetical protein